MSSLFLPTIENSKYPETILTIDRSALQRFPLKEGFTPYTNLYVDNFIADVWIAHSWRVRQDVDEKINWGESYKGNRDYVQWLNYCALEQDDGLLLPYMRSREGGGESDLKGRGSIGAGGHTDFDDAYSVGSRVYLYETAIINLARELWEECQFVGPDGKPLKIEITDETNPSRVAENIRTYDQALDFLSTLGTLHFEGFLFDNSDNVGRLHLGVCWRLKLHMGITAVSKEKGVDYIDPVAATEIYSKYPNVTFENWSKLYIAYLADPVFIKNAYPIFD